MRYLLLIAALMLGGHAWSIPPVAGKAETTDDRKTEATNNNQQSMTLPSTLNLNISGKLEIHPDQTKGGANQESSKWFDPITLFTLLLVVVGTMQAIFLRGTLKATETAANASRGSVHALEDQFIASHRPIVKVRHVWAEGDLWGDKEIAVRAQVVNVGITRAKITEYSVRTMVAKSIRDLPYPPKEIYGYCFKVTNDPNLESGQSAVLPADSDMIGARPFNVNPISHDDNAEIRGGRKKVFAWGYVTYLDLKGNPRTTAFCRELESGDVTEIGRFVRLKEPADAYEYQD
jgi:hypothetical protein